MKPSFFDSLLASVLVLFLAAGLVVPSQAENIILNGTTVKVTAGTTVVSSAALTIKSGGILDNSGTLILKSNLLNQNATPNSLGSGLVICSGTSLQELNGQSIFQDLTINNAAGVLNGSTNRINGVLTLTSGLLNVGSHALTLGPSATIGGAPSATAMVIPTGSGELRKIFSGLGSFTFPVGDNTGTAEYTPFTVNFTAGTFTASSYVGVNLVDDMYPGSPGGSYVSRYWNVSQSGIGSISANVTFQYVPADVVGTESSIYCVRILPSSVTYLNLANTATHQLTATGIGGFGTFTGYQTLTAKALNLTVLLEGLYNGAGTMRKAQNAIGDQFPGTTADQVTIELHNSASYASIAYSVPNVNLTTAGTCTASIPGILSGSYYVTLRHRNTIETTTATPIAFTSTPINYNFTNLATKAYGSNMKQLSGGYYVFFGGDVNQDGIVDSGDMLPVDNLSAIFATGYIPEDANGDGLIDASDMLIVDNNSNTFVSAVTPP